MSRSLGGAHSGEGARSATGRPIATATSTAITQYNDNAIMARRLPRSHVPHAWAQAYDVTSVEGGCCS